LGYEKLLADVTRHRVFEATPATVEIYAPINEAVL
jgi:hypothetical protein